MNYSSLKTMVRGLKLNGSLSSNDPAEIDELRNFRNEVAHGMSDHSTGMSATSAAAILPVDD